MTMRTWFFQTMIADVAVTDLVGSRAYQGESMTKAPDIKPYLVYRFGNKSPDNQVHTAKRQYVTVYLHDNPGTYDRIDDMEAAVIEALTSAPASPADGVVRVEYLETSADFDDQEMGTILRYIRFQLISALGWAST